MVEVHQNTDAPFLDHIPANFPYRISGLDNAAARPAELVALYVSEVLDSQDTKREIAPHPSPGDPGHTANRSSLALALEVRVAAAVVLVVLRFPLFHSIVYMRSHKIISSLAKECSFL